MGFKMNWAEPIILAIDTSSPEASLAISSAENIVATLTVRSNRPHSQTLFSHITTLLHIVEIRIQDISAFAVTTGPGSFTGLRVGLAAIKGLADSLNKPCLGVDSLDLLALATSLDGPHLVMINAGRGEVYYGFREVASRDIIVDRSISDNVGDPSTVSHALIQYLKKAMLIIVRDERFQYEEKGGDPISQLQIDGMPPPGSQQAIFLKLTPNISAVLAQRAAFLMKKQHIPLVRPHYIRQSDAEIH